MTLADFRESIWPGEWFDRPMVVGLDLSLTGTGIAYASGASVTIKTDGLTDVARLRTIRTHVVQALDVGESLPDLVMIEGYSFHSGGTALFKLGELGGVIRVAVAELALEDNSGMRWAVVPPATLKTYALGTGRGDKTAMVVAARERLGFAGLSHDQADALWLRAMGLDLLDSPLAPLPKTHRRALDAVEIHDKSEVNP